MPIALLYFAWVRDKVGIAQEEIEDFPKHIATPDDLIGWLVLRGGGYAEAFADKAKLRCAIDQQMATMDTRFNAPSEIAFFPPVTGG
jgi:sulfur-carrier protein